MSYSKDEIVAWIQRITRELEAMSPQEREAILEVMRQHVERERTTRQGDDLPSSCLP